MKCHADKLLMASIRKWTNCNDFHSLTASVHMSIWMSPCGVAICNSKLLWLLELDVMLAQGLLTWRKFHWWELRQIYKLNPWLSQRETERQREKLQQSFSKGDMHFSLLGMCTVARGRAKMFMAHLVLNTSVPMCHLCFSLGRDEIPESTVMWQGGEMSRQCFASAELNLIRF